MIKRLTIPAVHLEGTNKAEMLGALDRAHDACSRAYRALKDTAPDKRDYAICGPNAYWYAREEYLQRRRAIDSVRRELNKIAIGIYDNAWETEIEI